MGPLLSIKTVPFQYEMQVENAKLQIASPQAGYKMNRQQGKMQMKHTPAQIHIDSSQARASMGLIGVGTAAKQQGERGMSAALQATGQLAEEGNMLMDTRNQNVFGNIAFARSKSSIDTMLGFIPSTPSQVSFDQHQLSIQYEMDKLSFNWRTSNRPEMEFTPASIDIKIKNYARLEIEYLGGPIYVPKSADPNYVSPNPLDIKG